MLRLYRANNIGRSLLASSPFRTVGRHGCRYFQNNSQHGITLLSPSEVSEKLRELEESYIIERRKGVLRYDVAQLASNLPIEDDRSEKIVQMQVAEDAPDGTLKVTHSDWMFWGIFDGHSGWTTSAKLRDDIINFVLTQLDTVYPKRSPNGEDKLRLLPKSRAEIDRAIENGFLQLDEEIISKSIDRVVNTEHTSEAFEHVVAPALSGSCALLAFYDSYSSELKVTLTGDSRAILGTLNHADKETGEPSEDQAEWKVTQLSVDQTCTNKAEVERIKAEHPNEPGVIKRERVLGTLEPTRCFGDATYKWSQEYQTKLSERENYWFNHHMWNNYLTPPYITAKPVITSTKIDLKNGVSFLVLASDGLFELLSNEEIVGLVADWIEAKSPKYLSTIKKDSIWTRVFGNIKKKHDEGEATTKIDPDVDSLPIRRRKKPHFIVEDDNVSTHLIRNALGGADIEQVSMLVSIPAPISRNYRDDLTVTVVFFGEKKSVITNDPITSNGQQVIVSTGKDNDDLFGNIKINEKATRSTLKTHIKAKMWEKDIKKI